ncbi:MAG: hypothetical protein IJU25_04490, partial [Lachnospiraceae bacterium]|nr:hypothetical protein [Lachnospiraceae bacterium]
MAVVQSIAFMYNLYGPCMDQADGPETKDENNQSYRNTIRRSGLRKNYEQERKMIMLKKGITWLVTLTMLAGALAPATPVYAQSTGFSGEAGVEVSGSAFTESAVTDAATAEDQEGEAADAGT